MGGLVLRPVSTPRTFEAILRQFREAISSGALRAGDRLPPERELAAMFGVSRTSVREALRVLETLGIVGVRRGADNGAMLRTEPGNAFTTVLELLVALRHVPPDDVVEFRVMIECSAAERLCAHPDPVALAALRELLDRMGAPGVGQDEFHRLDATFHVTLVRCAGNQLVNLIETATDTTLRTLIADVAHTGSQWPVLRATLLHEHRTIYRALAAGDPQAARRRVADHVRRWGAAVIAAHSPAPAPPAPAAPTTAPTPAPPTAPTTAPTTAPAEGP